MKSSTNDPISNPNPRKKAEARGSSGDHCCEGPTIVQAQSLSQGQSTDSSLPLAYLLSISGPCKGQFVEIQAHAPLIIGRMREADIRIEDETISRKHAKILGHHRGQITILDLDTTNGTFVNDQPVDIQDLSHGDEIRIGESLFQFTQVESASDSQQSLNFFTSTSSLLNDSLSARQIEISLLVAEGLSNSQIGERLHISARTVSTHLEHIYERLDIRSRVELVIFCAKRGLLNHTQLSTDKTNLKKP